MLIPFRCSLLTGQFAQWRGRGKSYCVGVQRFMFGDISTIGLTECGSVVDDTLTSPGYPNAYPNDMDCVYKVSIQHGKALKIKFQNFDLDSASSCR